MALPFEAKKKKSMSKNQKQSTDASYQSELFGEKRKRSTREWMQKLETEFEAQGTVQACEIHIAIFVFPPSITCVQSFHNRCLRLTFRITIVYTIKHRIMSKSLFERLGVDSFDNLYNRRLRPTHAPGSDAAHAPCYCTTRQLKKTLL